MMDINDRAKQIKAEQRAAQEEVERKRQIAMHMAHDAEILHEKKIEEVHLLLARFLGWARKHHIPYNYSEKVSRFRRQEGWIIASRTYPVSGPYDHWDDHTDYFVLVDKENSLYVNGVHFSNVSALSLDNIGGFIAGFVAKHNIPWE